MRTLLALFWIFAFFSRIVVAVRGGSQLAHNYEAIYFYYGYLADVAINGDRRTIGVECRPASGTVCTFLEFIRSIEDEYDASFLPEHTELGATTRPGDLQELANAMTEWGYRTYDSENLVADGERRHTKLLLKATNILINARDNHPTVLGGGLLAQAKRALVYVQAQREKDNFSEKKSALLKQYDEGLVIVEKTVNLEDGLVSFQDIDWQKSAVVTAVIFEKTVQDMLESFAEYAQHMTVNTDIPKGTRDHMMILQSIRTQSDSLGSVAACRAIG